MRKNSIKNIRINQEVQKELSNLIRMEVKDPRVSPMTTIVNVEVAPDLKTAKVFISVLGDEKAQQDTIRGLKSAAPFLRSQLAHNMNMISPSNTVLICLILSMRSQPIFMMMKKMLRQMISMMLNPMMRKRFN